MLSVIENKVMSAVYRACKERNCILISPNELINMSSMRGTTIFKLEQILQDLKKDGYFELVYSDRRGEKIYCITLTEKGKGYNRSVKVLRRSVLFKIALSTLLAIFSFLLGLVLKKIF